MPKLILCRHGQSEWNAKNLFTGWADVDLSEQGKQEAITSGQKLKRQEIEIDIVYTSLLKRAINTTYYLLEQSDQLYIPVVKSWRLNERHYGGLQGLNKDDARKQYGEQQVHLWRRSYDVKPPEQNSKQ
ncbi:2,3-bisphosphoglycerate-dependent phosphoglycerate mutase, partial [Staphylococcus arlettae]